MIPAYFNSFDICAAYLALENDYNSGGWLQQRPSNARRKESTGVQLRRIGFNPGADFYCAFEYLQNHNQCAIYVNALQRFGLPLDYDDETHRLILAFIGAWFAGRLKG